MRGPRPSQWKGDGKPPQSKHKHKPIENKTMKANNNNTVAIETATRIASLLWESHVTIATHLQHAILDLDKALGYKGPKAMGLAIADAWQAIGGEVTPPIRTLAVACFDAGISRGDASKLVNATQWASRGRISTVLSSTYGELADDSKAGKGNTKADKGKSNEKLDSNGKAVVNDTPTVAAIIAAIAKLPALTAADASAIATAIKAKLG